MTTRCMTPIFRASYANVFEPRAAGEDGEARFSISMIFPKDTDLSEMKACAKEAIKAKWGDKPPKNLHLPFRDGDEDREDDPAYENSIFVNASSKNKPGLVDAKVKPILDEDEFYSGCYARATVNFFAFDKNGNRGVGVGLNNIQKIKDGDRLDSRKSAEADFEGMEVDGGDDGTKDLLG